MAILFVWVAVGWGSAPPEDEGLLDGDAYNPGRAGARPYHPYACKPVAPQRDPAEFAEIYFFSLATDAGCPLSY